MKDKFDKHMKKILKEMCKRVGAKYKEIDFLAEGWFNNYNWTQEEENDFKQWMVKYLDNNRDAFKEISNFDHYTKENVCKLVDEFVFFCGWSY